MRDFIEALQRNKAYALFDILDDDLVCLNEGRQSMGGYLVNLIVFFRDLSLKLGKSSKLMVQFDSKLLSQDIHQIASLSLFRRGSCFG